MPKTSAGKAILGVTSLVVGAVTGIPFFYSFGVNMILAGAAQEMADEPQPPESAGVKINWQGEERPLYLVFGQHRVGGHTSVLGVSGTHNEYLHIGITHSVATKAGMSDVTDIWLDERKIDDTIIDSSGNITDGDYEGIVNIRRYLGTDSETADAIFTAAIDYMDSDSTGKGLARTHVRFEKVDDDEAFRKAFPRGVPKITALLEGRCYDPREDSTNGGSGSQRADDEDTWAFSQNPALCAATYLIMARTDGGWGISPSRINWTSVAAAANRCDDQVTRPDNVGGTVSAARHTCNIVLDTGDGIRTNLGKILSAMDGTVYTGLDGQINVVAGEYDSPTTTIDDSWIRPGEIAADLDTDDDRIYNAVRARYIEPLVGWQPVSCVPYTNSTYATADGREEYIDLEIPATTDRYEAQYLCAIAGRKSRHQKSVTLPLNYRGFDVELWENVTLDLNDPDISGVFKVVNWRFEKAGPVVVLLEQSSTAWDSDIDDYTETTPTLPASLVHETPPTPSGVTATATIEGIALDWDPLGAGEYAQILVYRSTSEEGTYTNVADVRGNRYIDPITNGATYYYKLKATSPLANGTNSEFSAVVSATAKVFNDYTGGRGVNIANPRYSTFSEAERPPLSVSSGLTVARPDTAEIFTGHFIQASWSSEDTSRRINFTTGITDYNLRITPGKKWIVSGWMSAPQNIDVGIALVGKDSGESAIKTISLSIAGTINEDRFSVVIDMSGTTDNYAFLRWYPDRTGLSSGISRITGIMVEEQIGNQTEPSAYSPPSGYAGDSAIAADNGRLADQRSALAIINANYTNGLVTVAAGNSPLMGFDGGSTATMRLKACTIQFGFGQVSYNQSDATGLDFNAQYHGYASDPGLSGGTVTLLATKTEYVPSSSYENVRFGSIIMPANGGDATDGTNDVLCVQADAWVDANLQACDVERGNRILCWAGEEMFLGPVQAVGPVKRMPCVRLETETGAVLTCSESTPIEQPDGRTVLAMHMHGGKVLTEQRDGSFQWEPVKVPQYVGLQYVAKISVGGISFAASDEKGGRRIVTHNALKT